MNNSISKFLIWLFEGEGKKPFMYILFGAMGLLVAIDIFMPRHHIYFLIDRIPGFSTVFGFIACVAIIVISKLLGKYWLQKPEDYYGDD